MDVAKLMPNVWEIPEEFFSVNMPTSENPTINYCDAIMRKAHLIREKFRGNSLPAYMKGKRNIEVNKTVQDEPKS